MIQAAVAETSESAPSPSSIEAVPADDLYRAAGWWAFVATAAATPLFVSLSALDMFDIPKELLLRAGGILATAALLLRAIFAPGALVEDVRRHRVAAILAALAVVWTAVATIFSTNQALSVWTLLRVFFCAALALAAVIGASRRPLGSVYFLLVPAVINAIVVIAQEGRIWDPIYEGSAEIIRSGLIGNSNWLGTYLLFPTIAAFALAFAVRKRRALHGAIAAVLTAGVVITQSVTAVAALVVGAVAVAAMHSWRRAAVAVLVLAAGLAVVVPNYAPAARRAAILRQAIELGDWNRLTSDRITAYAAAASMFLDRPLTGVGPGCFALRYFEYKIRVEAEYTHLRQSLERQHNFGEAHNDHLETLAVAGFPGYALLVAALVFVGSRSWRARPRRTSSPRAAFTYELALPLALSTAVLMLAQFPLERAAAMVTLLFAAALCAAWSDDGQTA